MCSGNLEYESALKVKNVSQTKEQRSKCSIWLNISELIIQIKHVSIQGRYVQSHQVSVVKTPMFSVWSWYTCYRGAARGCSRRGRRSWGGRGPAAPTPRSARGYCGPGGWKYPRHGTRWREEVQRSDIFLIYTRWHVSILPALWLAEVAHEVQGLVGAVEPGGQLLRHPPPLHQVPVTVHLHLPHAASWPQVCKQVSGYTSTIQHHLPMFP